MDKSKSSTGSMSLADASIMKEPIFNKQLDFCTSQSSGTCRSLIIEQTSATELSCTGLILERRQTE